MKFYGLDCHSDNIKMVVFDSKGNVIQKKKINIINQLPIWLKTLTKSDSVALESSTNSFALYDLISPRVKECYVLNQRKIPEIWNGSKKTDYIDAEKLAERIWLAYSLNDMSKERLPRVYVPEHTIRNLRGLFTSLEHLREESVRIRNKIHAFFKQSGYCISKASIDSKQFLDYVHTFNLEPVVVCQIELFYQLLKGCHLQAEKMKDLICKEGEKYKEDVNLLVSIPGISHIGALAIISDIADISRFKSAKNLCSYLRTAPKVDSSNNQVHIGHINKCSRKQSLFYILQAEQFMVQHNKRLDRFYQQKKNGKSTGKVRIAVARKTMVAIFHMLKRRELYRYYDINLYNRKVAAFQRNIQKVA